MTRSNVIIMSTFNLAKAACEALPYREQNSDSEEDYERDEEVTTDVTPDLTSDNLCC